MKGRSTGPVIIGSFLFFFSGYLIYLARKLPSVNPYGMANAAFWPTIMLTILMLLSLILVGSSIRKGRQAQGEAEGEPKEKINLKRWSSILAVLLLWPLAMQMIGFLLSTLLLFGVMVYLFGEKRWAALIIVPLSITVLMYLLFIQFLFIPFPRGAGVFGELSLLFY